MINVLKALHAKGGPFANLPTSSTPVKSQAGRMCSTPKLEHIDSVVRAVNDGASSLYGTLKPPHYGGPFIPGKSMAGVVYGLPNTTVVHRGSSKTDELIQ